MRIRVAILVMKDWRERVFLRAELTEQGVRTFAVEVMDEADEWISDNRIVPMILIYDDRFQKNPSEDIKHLSRYVSSFPILIIAGASEMRTREFKHSGFNHIVLRPVSIETVVKKVKEILSQSAIGPT